MPKRGRRILSNHERDAEWSAREQRRSELDVDAADWLLVLFATTPADEPIDFIVPSSSVGPRFLEPSAAAGDPFD